jgi:hypothetical protein
VEQMKGTIKKYNEIWMVDYDGMLLPLHPESMETINELSKIFDNIDARILSNPEVEFDLVEVCYDNKFPEVKLFAKLKNI